MSFLLFGFICKSIKNVNFFIENVKDDELQLFLNHPSKYGDAFNVAIDQWDCLIMNTILQKMYLIEFNEKALNEIIYECAFYNDTKSMFYILNYIKSNKNEDDFNFNYQNKNLRTPLHIATLRQKYIIASMLANCDQTDLTLLDLNGKSALHVACMTNMLNHKFHHRHQI